MSEIDRKEKERVRLTEKGRDTEIGIEREREGGGEIDKVRRREKREIESDSQCRNECQLMRTSTFEYVLYA